MKKYIAIAVAFVFGIVVGNYSATCEDCSKVKNNLSVCTQALDIMPELTDTCINVMYAGLEQDGDALQREAEKINDLTTRFQALTEQVK
jgi:hypothetical protein